MKIISFKAAARTSLSDAPKVYVPMIVGKPKAPGIMVGLDQKPFYVGSEAISKQSMLNIAEPVQSGVVQDIEMLEQIFEHLQNNELRLSFEEHKVLLTEPPNNPKKNR